MVRHLLERIHEPVEFGDNIIGELLINATLESSRLDLVVCRNLLRYRDGMIAQLSQSLPSQSINFNIAIVSNHEEQYK